MASPVSGPAVMGTRQMRGWVRVAGSALDDDALRTWWARAVSAAGEA